MLARALYNMFRPRSGPSSASDFWYNALAGAMSNTVATPDTALRVSAVWACCRVLCNAVASIPLVLYERLPDGGKRRASDHPLYGLLHDRPNEWQSSYEFREMMQLHLLLRGNAYAVIVPDMQGNVAQLLPLHPDRVQVDRISNGRLRYTVRRQNGEHVVYAQDEIFHIRGLSSDGMVGLSPIDAMRNAVSAALATDRHAERVFTQAARPAGVLEIPASMQDKAMENVRRSWQETYGGAENAGKVAILREGMKFNAIGMTAEDSQFIETRQYQVTDIARIMGVPPHLIGDLSRATFSNVEQQSLDFILHSARPWYVRWESRIGLDLLAEEDVFAEFLIDAYLRGDTASRYAAHATAINNGWMSRNEVRVIENLNPVDGLDGYLVPLNMATAEEAAQLAVGDIEDEPLNPPTPAQGEASEPPVVSDEKAAAVLRMMSVDAAGRLVQAETRELEKVLKRGVSGEALTAWVGEFYAKHIGYVAKTLVPVANAYTAVYGGERDVAALSQSIVDDAKRQIEKSDPRVLVVQWHASRVADVGASIMDAMEVASA